MSIDFCPEYIAGDPELDISVNMSNSNAFRVLESLDIEPDYCGSIDAADLAGRVLTAMAVGARAIEDPFVPGEQIGANGARFFDCAGPIDEYLARRLPDLLWVANECMALGRDVTWA